MMAEGNNGYIPSGNQQLNVALYALFGEFQQEDMPEKKKIEILLGE